MKAITMKRHGASDALIFEEINTPTPGAGEVLIRLCAAGVNHVDIDIRNGISGMHTSLPHVLGVDGAGEIAELGPDVTRWKVGDRVAPHFILNCGICRNCRKGRDNICSNFSILGANQWGTYAEYVVVPAHTMVPVPEGLSCENAAAGGVPFATAWEGLVTTANLKPGETVLINAAGSGVGSSALQVAKLAGARIIASAGSDEKLRRAKELGAHEVINYNDTSLSDAVLDMTAGDGVDVALDMVGGTILLQTIQSLSSGGRLATVGAHAGEEVKIDMIDFFRKHISIHGCGRSTKSGFEKVFDLMADGGLRPIIHQTFPLAQAGEAHNIMESRNFFGRMILVPEW
jgi:NADPH:quinone reductase-like Zn-dependent oxidoreductase